MPDLDLVVRQVRIQLAWAVHHLRWHRVVRIRRARRREQPLQEELSVWSRERAEDRACGVLGEFVGGPRCGVGVWVRGSVTVGIDLCWVRGSIEVVVGPWWAGGDVRCV